MTVQRGVESGALLPFVPDELIGRGRALLRLPASARSDLHRVLARLLIEPGDIVVVARPDPRLALASFFDLLELGVVPALAAGGSSSSRLRALATGIGARAVLGGDVEGTRIIYTSDSTGPCTRRDPGDVVLLTSGTSGPATGVIHRLDLLVRNGLRHMAATGHDEADRLLVTLPVHYSFALVAQVLGAAARGADLIFDAPPFTAAHFLHTLVHHQVTSASLTPRLLETLVNGLRVVPPGLRAISVGGSRVRPALINQLLRVAPIEVYLTYGLTEAGPRVSTLAAHLEPEHRLGSVGVPLPGVQVSMTAPTNPDEPTELIVDTDTRCVATVGHRPPLAPGPLQTGDIGRVDNNGYVWVEGRRRDIVVVQGEKIRLPDLEAVAETLPGVHRARFSVLGSTDDAEAVTAVLTVADDAPKDPEWFRRHLARVLRRVEVPRQIQLEIGPAEWRK